MASILRIVLARVPHCLLSGALVAQLVEHLICNQGVGGSSPSGGTIQINNLAADVRNSHFTICNRGSRRLSVKHDYRRKEQ